MVVRGMVCLVTAILNSCIALVLTQGLWLPLALAVIAVFAASQTTFSTSNGVLVQTLAPDELRGRVTSLQRWSQGFVVLSSLVIVWFAGVTSVRIALTAMGLTRPPNDHRIDDTIGVLWFNLNTGPLVPGRHTTA